MRIDNQLNAYPGNQISRVNQLPRASSPPYTSRIMINTKLEAQRQTILHHWLNGTRSAKEIHQKTSIPLRTVERNIKKLKETGTVEHKRGNGRPSKVTKRVAAAIGQHIRRNSVISTRELAIKVQENQGISISHQAIWLNMKKRGT